MAKGAIVCMAYETVNGVPFDLLSVLDQLDNQGIGYAVNWHDKDVKMDDKGDPVTDAAGNLVYKEKHAHLILGSDKMSSGKLYDLAQSLGLKTPPTKSKAEVIDIKGAVRYLTHENNPEKAQYDPQAVVYGRHWQPSAYVTQHNQAQMRRDQSYRGFKMLMDYIVAHEITEIYDLYCELSQMGKDSDLYVGALMKHFSKAKGMVDSIRNKHKDAAKAIAEAAAEVRGADKHDARVDDDEQAQIDAATANCTTDEERLDMTAASLLELRSQAIQSNCGMSEISEMWMQTNQDAIAAKRQVLGIAPDDTFSARVSAIRGRTPQEHNDSASPSDMRNRPAQI